MIISDENAREPSMHYEKDIRNSQRTKARLKLADYIATHITNSHAKKERYTRDLRRRKL